MQKHARLGLLENTFSLSRRWTGRSAFWME